MVRTSGVGECVAVGGTKTLNGARMEELQQGLLEAVAGYPYEVAPEERGAAFDELAERFDAPSLVLAIAQEKREGLLPFLEAAQASHALSDAPRHASGPLLWLEAEDGYENEFTASVFSALSQGPAALEVEEEPSLAYSLGRFRALAARLSGAGGIVCPLSCAHTLALDLLLARLVGISVAGVAPSPLAAALGEEGGLPKLMVVAQTLSVVVVPKTVNATFWTMAAHTEIVDAERIGSSTELAGEIARALAAPSRPKRKAAPKKGASLEGAFARAGAAGLAGWQHLAFPPLVAPGSRAKDREDERTIEELRRENEALRAELERLRGEGAPTSE